jgi:hypothetical protein
MAGRPGHSGKETAMVTENDTDRAGADCHDMLLRLAGRLPDDLITRCRGQLAEGALGELARAVASCVQSSDVPLAGADVEVLTALLAGTGGDPSALSEVKIDDSDPMTWRFTDNLPGTSAEELDQAMSDALAEEEAAIGCWRAWRVSGDDVPQDAAKAVFVVEVQPDADMAGITARLQERLAATGEDNPQVEVCSWDFEPPAYQRLASGFGELIWAAEEDPGMLIASIFDDVDPQDGPRFSPDHPRLDPDEAAKVARYLREAEAVLVTTARMDDVIDASRKYCVPLNFRTDGLWIWTEASAYYAQEHLLEPDPGLLAHIRSNNHAVPGVSGVAMRRALDALQQPSEEEPVWTFGGLPDEDAPGQYGADIVLDDDSLDDDSLDDDSLDDDSLDDDSLDDDSLDDDEPDEPDDNDKPDDNELEDDDDTPPDDDTPHDDDAGNPRTLKARLN